jgi:hypothetical protein
MNEFDKKCLHLVLANLGCLPKYVPRGREYFCECDTYLYNILQDVKKGELSDSNRSNLYFLNTLVLSYRGRLVHS